MQRVGAQMSTTDRLDYARGPPPPTGVTNVNLPGLVGGAAGPTDPLAFAQPWAAAPNPEMLMRWMALARPPTVPGMPAASPPAPGLMPGADPNFYSPMLMAMFDQMLKGHAATSAPTAPPAPPVRAPAPASTTNGRQSTADKFFVVRELRLSSTDVTVAVESGPIEQLDEAYAVLQHVKSRSRPDTDPDQVVSLHKDITVWNEPATMQGFFLVQMPAAEMHLLTQAVRARAPAGDSFGSPTEGARRAAASRHGLVGAKGAGLPPLRGPNASAFRPVSSPGYDRSVSTNSMHKAEGAGVHNGPSPSSSDHEEAHKPSTKPVAVSRLAAGSHSASEPAGSKVVKQGSQGGHRTLAEAVDAAARRGNESPEASDYSVNRSYQEQQQAAQQHSGGAAAPEPAAPAAKTDADMQAEEMDALVGMMALSKSVKGEAEEHGTPPSSDGTRAYLTSSDDEFNALKNPPKRRRSVYQPPTVLVAAAPEPMAAVPAVAPAPEGGMGAC